MPKMTLISMVQTILSDLNEDEVNSIDDTQTANQVATVVRDTYYHLISERIWPIHQNVAQLQAVSNDSYPTHMKVPDDVATVVSLRYNSKDQMSDATGLEEAKEIVYLSPEEFIQRSYNHNPAASNVSTIIDNLSTDGVRLLIETDKSPEYWTSFDDEHIIFDSYDSTYDDTLQAQKSMALVEKEPSWTPSDTFIPDMPAKAFSYLLEEAKKAAFISIKQTSNPVAEERARRQRTWQAGAKHRTRNKGIRYPDYGRRT
jgi:hypothetical protein